jgi:glycosyltransferase involved in cell wall biosynthesis
MGEIMGGLVSIVIPTLNEGENLRKTVRSIQETTSCDYEIIVVDNGSNDGSSDFIEKELRYPRIRLFKTERLGAARARNYGAKEAVGKFIIFVDAHILFPPGWVSALIKSFEGSSVAIAGPAISAWDSSSAKGFGFRWRNARFDIEWLPRQRLEAYSVPMVGSGCMAVRRTIFEAMEGFDSGMMNYGSEDSEFCLRAWLLGHTVLVVPSIEVSHYFRSHHPYEVTWRQVIHNMLRTAFCHFNNDRIQKVTAALNHYPQYHEAFELVTNNGVQRRRERLLATRKHDDNWFFQNFQIDF